MKLSDAIKQLKKGYNLTNFQQAELLENLSNNNGGGDPTDSISVLDLGLNVDDIDIKWEDLQKVDIIRISGEGVSIILIKAPGDENIVSFYGQVDDTSFARFTFINVDGKAKMYEFVFDSYREIADTISGVGDSETALSTLGANTLLKRKADLVNGLVPAAQLPSYVDDVLNFNGSTIDIISDSTESSILEYNKNTIWIGNSSVEPYRSKYYQKLIYVNANTSKEDWVIKDPEEGKIYVNIGPDGESTTGDTYRWSGKAWINLNQNLNNKVNALNDNIKEINLGDKVNIYDLESLPSDKVLAIWDVIVTGATHIEFTYNIYRIASQRIDYVSKAFSLILPNGQIDNYIFSGVHPDNLHLIKSSSSGRVVLLKESNLNMTYTNQDTVADLMNAAKLIVEFPNAGIKEFHRGSVSGDVINFVNANSTTGAQIISFNKANGKLTGMTYSAFAPNALFYDEYSSAGGTLTKTELNKWMADMTNRTLFISRSDINVELSANENGSIKSSSIIVILDPDGTKSPVPCFRTSTENNNYIWYGWLNASTVERLSYDDSTRKFAITNMQIGKDSLDSRIMNLPYSQLGTTVSSVAGQEIKRSSAIVLTTTDANDQYNNVMFTRASTSATEIKFVNPTITGSSYGVEYITYNPETRSLSSINV